PLHDALPIYLCAEDEMNLASSKRQWPLGRGFERYYGFLGGETNQWYPNLVEDNHPVPQPQLPPHEVNGYTQKPIEGVSFAYSFDAADAPTQKETQFYSMLGTRAIWHKGWKASTAVPAAPESWGDFHLQKWELFDTEADPSECNDLAEQHPGKLRELTALWWAEAGAHQALPLESRSAIEILGAARPELSG